MRAEGKGIYFNAGAKEIVRVTDSDPALSVELADQRRAVWAVAPDRFCADVVAELAEFAPDADAAPARVLPGDALNQRTKLRREAWTSRTAAVTLPCPVTLPGGAVPADDCVRLDEEQRGTPGGPVAGELGPEEAVGGPESGSAGRTGEDEELMAEGEVL